jgi:hypothetical protein
VCSDAGLIATTSATYVAELRAASR